MSTNTTQTKSQNPLQYPSQDPFTFCNFLRNCTSNVVRKIILRNRHRKLKQICRSPVISYQQQQLNRDCKPEHPLDRGVIVLITWVDTAKDSSSLHKTHSSYHRNTTPSLSIQVWSNFYEQLFVKQLTLTRVPQPHCTFGNYDF